MRRSVKDVNAAHAKENEMQAFIRAGNEEVTENDKREHVGRSGRGAEGVAYCVHLDFFVAITVTRRKIALHICVCQKQREWANPTRFRNRMSVQYDSCF